MTTTGLVRVTIATAQRRVDLALPEWSVVAELMPGLLRHAGAAAGDTGWMLRRADGGAVDDRRTLGAQRVHDGEILHLVPDVVDWPEPDYDDLVDAVAGGAGRAGRAWEPRHTRAAGLTVAAVTVLLVLLAVLRAGPPWPGPGRAALAVAAVLLLAGTLLARALGDAGAGAVAATAALPAALLGGVLLLGGGTGAAQLLAGCSAVLVAGALAHLGVVDRAAVFVTATTAALLGALAATAVTLGLADGTGAAAVLATTVFLFSPVTASVAARLGRVPMPVLPRTAADLVRDEPQPPRRAVHAAVLRADGLLTGMLCGGALVTAAALAMLSRAPGTPALVLAALVSAGCAVRARLYPALRHRLPLLLAALTGAACLAAGVRQPLAPVVTVLLLLGAGAVTVATVHSRRAPGAALSRYAELVEVVLVLACVPVLCALLGLYALVRGLGG